MKKEAMELVGIAKRLVAGMFRPGDKVMLRHDVLLRHSRSVPPHAGYTTEQFAWRKTLDGLEGEVGVIERVFPSSKHVNVQFAGTMIGIDNTELELVEEGRTAHDDSATDIPIEEQIADAKFALASQLKPILGLQPSFNVRVIGKYMYFIDDIGRSAMGIFSSVFKEAFVKVVISLIPVSDGTYYGRVSMEWTHHSGGTNGGDVARAWYNPEKGSWFIEKA